MHNTEYLALKVNQPRIVKEDQVFVESGIVWLTQSGHLNDVILFANQSYRLQRPGTVVIMALSEDAKVTLQSNFLGFRALKLISALFNGVSSNFRFEFYSMRISGRSCFSIFSHYVNDGPKRRGGNTITADVHLPLK